MKTLNSILLALILAILCSALIVGSVFFYNEYNDYQQSKNNQVEETYNPPQEVQQQKYDDQIEEQQDDSQEITPSGLTVEEYNKLPHNDAGTNNYEYAKENGLIQEDN